MNRTWSNAEVSVCYESDKDPLLVHAPCNQATLLQAKHVDECCHACNDIIHNFCQSFFSMLIGRPISQCIITGRVVVIVVL